MFGHRIVWDDADGVGMVLGEGSGADPNIEALEAALDAVGTQRDTRGYHWDTNKEARTALRLVKAADKAYKAKVPAVCPCCKREMPK